MAESVLTDQERALTNQVADLKRQLGAERDGRMRAEALLDDTRRANESLRSDLAHWKKMYECAQNANALRQKAIEG